MNISGMANSNYYARRSSMAENAKNMISSGTSKVEDVFSNIKGNDFGVKGSATKITDSSDDGKRIGLLTMGQTVYIATYADSSTPAKPIVKIGDYEISVKDVNPENATEMEMCALLSYLDDTNQTNNKGICSFGKMRAFADFGELGGVCTGIKDADTICNKKQNWVDIIKEMKQMFLGNSQTYSQAVDCDNLLYAMSKVEK